MAFVEVETISTTNFCLQPVGRFNIKTLSYKYKNFHYKDGTVMRLSDLHNGTLIRIRHLNIALPPSILPLFSAEKASRVGTLISYEMTTLVEDRVLIVKYYLFLLIICCNYYLYMISL